MPYAVEMHLGVQIPMRDGIYLSADIYLPKAHGPFPTVLVRTPYSNNSDPAVMRARALANNGYVCVLQDTRGRWDSGGDYYPLQGEGVDGYDTQEWIGRQPWSNGKIATSGGSYLGHVQWQSAPYGSHYLTAMTPRVIGPNFFKLLRPGGAFQLNVCATWGASTSEHTGQSIAYHDWTELFYTLPLRDLDEAAGRTLPFWQDFFAHPTYDEYWAAMDIEEQWGKITTPAFNMGGWYDIFSEGSFACFNGLRQHGGSPAARQSKLIVGPWVHALSISPKVGDVDFGFHSMQDLDALEFRWLEQWLKGVHTGILDEAPLRLFIMGTNEWRDEYEWPLARTEWQQWHLHFPRFDRNLNTGGTFGQESELRSARQTVYHEKAYPSHLVLPVIRHVT